jgi:molybdopterin molybdotransferase
LKLDKYSPKKPVETDTNSGYTHNLETITDIHYRVRMKKYHPHSSRIAANTVYAFGQDARNTTGQYKDTSVPLDKARDHLLDHATAIDGQENVPLADALGRIAFEDVRASIPLPPFDRSAVDGYAVDHRAIANASSDSPVTFRIAQMLFAGDIPSAPLHPGETALVMTGAMLPQGADCVMWQEEAVADAQTATLLRPLSRYCNCRFQGEDIKEGLLLISHGDIFTAALLALAAGQGIAALRVFRRLKVAVLPTGDELTPQGDRLPLGKIYDSNSFYLEARLKTLGMSPMREKACPDDPEMLYARLRSLIKDNDAIITIGGVASGKKDFLPRVATRLAVENNGTVLFDGKRICPGAWSLCMTMGNKLLMGLPGDTGSASFNFELMTLPALKKMAGYKDFQWQRGTGIVRDEYRKRAHSRRNLVPAAIVGKEIFIPQTKESVIMGKYNCFVDIPPETGDLVPGMEAEVILLEHEYCEKQRMPGQNEVPPATEA